MSRTVRVFVGVPLSEPAQSQIGRLQEACPIGRDVPLDNLHITLAFCGDQQMRTLEDLDAELDQILVEPFTAKLSGVEFYGANGASMALKCVPNSALEALHDRVASAARAVDIVLERRRFRPHVTFARCNRPPDQTRMQRFLDTHGTFGNVDVQVSHFALYRSTLHADGAVYDILAEYPARGGTERFG